VNKIAAGEVIERPASVVKELLENACDAGSTRIDVRLEKGGSEVIRIADNGCCIQGRRAAARRASHATSKITSADDLFRLRRSVPVARRWLRIAEISRLLIRSRTADGTSGGELVKLSAGVGESSDAEWLPIRHDDWRCGICLLIHPVRHKFCGPFSLK